MKNLEKFDTAEIKNHNLTILENAIFETFGFTKEEDLLVMEDVKYICKSNRTDLILFTNCDVKDVEYCVDLLKNNGWNV